MKRVVGFVMISPALFGLGAGFAWTVVNHPWELLIGVGLFMFIVATGVGFQLLID